MEYELHDPYSRLEITEQRSWTFIWFRVWAGVVSFLVIALCVVNCLVIYVLYCELQLTNTYIGQGVGILQTWSTRLSQYLPAQGS